MLNELSQLIGFEGIIGGTSGTLDAAAFMGIKVLNIHTFKPKSENKCIMRYQDFRILLQTNFMSVCQSVSEDLIEAWLKNHYSLSLGGQLHTLYDIPENNSIEFETKKHEHHNDRVPFIFCSALMKHPDTETIKRGSENIEVRVLNLLFDIQKSLILEYFKIAKLYKSYIEHKKEQKTMFLFWQKEKEQNINLDFKSLTSDDDGEDSINILIKSLPEKLRLKN